MFNGRRVLTAGLAVALVMAGASDANAYSVKPDCGTAPPGRIVQYVFSSSPQWQAYNPVWDDSADFVVARAFKRWDNEMSRNATPLVSIDDAAAQGSRAITATFVTNPGGDPDARGNYLCKTHVIEFNTTLLDLPVAALVATATHEMGHALGYQHTGMSDSLTPAGYLAVMSTCHGDDKSIETDDAAAETHSYGIASNRTLTANYGFENSWDAVEHFGASGAAPSVASGSTSGGLRHATVAPASSSDNVNQTVALVNASGTWVRPSMQYTTPGATAGAVRVQMWAREATYPYQASPCNAFPLPNRNFNLRAKGSFESEWYLALDETLPLSSTWRVGMTANQYYVPLVLDNSVPPRENGGIDLRVRVYSNASASGGYVHVHYDDLRIQEG